ncbi:MAG: hypothetical protein O6922_06140, partial [Chloroflexi bacterium]|nr:hypothetical protein [Chloroflexota bacterium]
MAMKSSSDGGASSGFLRRLVVGSNVLVTIGLALVVVLFVNWFAQRYNYRRDLSSLGANRLSERTLRILDRAQEEIRLTAIYTSDEPEKSRRQYLPRIEDLFEEMALHNPNLKTEIVHSDDQKRQLEKRVRRAFAAQADEHTQALEKATQLEDELTQTLQMQATLLRQLRDSGAWITRFSSFTNIAQNIAGLSEVLSKTRDQVEALTTGQALPDFSAANNRVKTAHEQIRTVLTESKNWMEELNKLLVAVSEGRAEIIQALPERMAELGTLVEALGAAVGTPGDPMPEDPGAALKEYGRAAGALSTFLAGEIARLQNFSDEYPVIVEHPYWAIHVSLIGNLGTRMDLPTLLRQEQQNLANLRPQIVALLSGDPEPNQLRLALERVRNITRDMQISLKETAEVLQRLPGDLAGVDAATRDLLNAGGLTSTLSDLSERLDENIKQIEELPELKLGTVGRDLTQENTIVVEAGNKVKVIRFDDAWPIEHEDVSIPGRRGDIHRAFNGDSSISAALLTMTEEKPIAAIIMIVFEPQVPVQLKRMARPPSGVYPAMYFERLRQRLRDAHFTTQTWNLADADAPPELEEDGLDRVFLVMPPLEYLVPPFGAQQGMTIPKLDDTKKRLVFDSIGETGRALFLCNYAPPQSAMMGMFGAGPVSQPRYAYDEYLQTTW